MKKNREFEKNSSILFILLMVANVINYLFQIITGRLLDVDVYGELNSLLSIFTLCSLPSAALNLVVSKFVTEYDAKNMKGEAKGFLKLITKYIIIIALIVMVIGICASGVIAKFVNSSDKKIIMVLFFSVATCVLVSVVLGGLQGIKKFSDYGLINLIMPAIKIVGSIIFIILGFKLYGIFASIAIGYIVTFIIGTYIINKYFKDASYKKIDLSIIEILKFSLGSFIINLGISFFTNIDVILVRHYFQPDVVGLYSSAAVLAKMILYVSTAITVALFPMAVESAKNGNAFHILKKGLVYGGGISAVTAMGLIIFRKLMINILYGSKYNGAEKYILPLSLMIVVLSLLSIIANYILAIGNIKILSFSMVSGIILVILLSIIFNKTIVAIIINISVVMLAVFLCNIFYALKRK